MSISSLIARFWLINFAQMAPAQDCYWRKLSGVIRRSIVPKQFRKYVRWIGWYDIQNHSPSSHLISSHLLPVPIFLRRSPPVLRIWIVSIATVFHLTRNMQEPSNLPIVFMVGWSALVCHCVVVLPTRLSSATDLVSLYYLSSKSNSLPLIWFGSEWVSSSSKESSSFNFGTEATAPVLNEWQMNKLLLLPAPGSWLLFSNAMGPRFVVLPRHGCQSVERGRVLQRE